jgi:hypothetical protein
MRVNWLRGLCHHHAACVSIYPVINFWMPEPIFTKLGMHTMEPELISTAHSINPYHQSLCEDVYLSCSS